MAVRWVGFGTLAEKTFAGQNKKLLAQIWASMNRFWSKSFFGYVHNHTGYPKGQVRSYYPKTNWDIKSQNKLEIQKDKFHPCQPPPQTSASAAGGESSRVNPSMRHTVGSKRAAPDPALRSAPDDEHTESDASASLPSTSSSSEYVLSPSASSSSSEYVLSSPSIEGSAPATRYSLCPRR
ncbi:unnamed protein product [Prunus armeniaca]|uniref:Uncharacterized protein n=1 Tax=Prunus armeniaca TaxID=36596 RepID=A0A6J5WHP3_PRUAR|nr:unnamed protein product [Prunus armeniaca]